MAGETLQKMRVETHREDDVDNTAKQLGFFIHSEDRGHDEVEDMAYYVVGVEE